MATTLLLSPADLSRQSRLRRAKTVATGLLLLAAAVFVAVRPAEQAGYAWAGYVSTAAEAAMVGGLADWFAVTALFRRPLGLPIPHTALIPTRKAALGESLGDFVGENFLAPAVVRRRLQQADVVGRLGAWLRAPGNAHLVTAEAANALKGLLEVVRDEDVRAVAEDAIRRRIAGVDLAPGLGRLLGQVVADGAHRPLVELVAQRTAHWLRENPDTVIGVIQQQAPTWSPAFVDRALARRIHAELVRISAATAADPQHPLRLTLDSYLVSLAGDLQHDSGTGVRFQALVTRLVENPGTREAVGTLVSAVRRAVVELVDEPDGELRLACGRRRDRPRGQARRGRRAAREGRRVARGGRGARRHELPVGDHPHHHGHRRPLGRRRGVPSHRAHGGPGPAVHPGDGTLVGALAGLAIHAVSELL